MLCAVFVFHGFTLSVSAADETILVSDMSVTMHRTETVDGVTTWNKYDFTDGNTEIGGKNVHWFKATNPAFYASGGQKITTLFDSGEIAAGHEYEMSFFAGLNFNMRFNIRIFLDGAAIYNHDFSSAGSLAKVNVKFTAPAEITNNAQIQVVMTIPEGSGYGSDGKNAYFYISENLEFTDLTENPTWLQKILKKFTELGDTIGGFFNGLGNRIGGFFSNLSNSMSEWFAEQKQKIQDFSDSVGQWFDDLKLKIETAFQSAIDEIKSWFIPHEGYFDEYAATWKDWATEHLGVLIQIPEITIDVLRRLGSILETNSYTFTFPEISLPVDGKTYVFVEAQTVDMDYWLNGNQTVGYMYDIYTVMIWALFVFALFKYAKVLEDTIFGTSESGD